MTEEQNALGIPLSVAARVAATTTRHRATHPVDANGIVRSAPTDRTTPPDEEQGARYSATELLDGLNQTTPSTAPYADAINDARLAGNWPLVFTLRQRQHLATDEIA